MKLLQLGLLLSLTVAPLFAADKEFDRWVDEFSAEWMRTNPNAATAAQYFKGAEQDALDRQLTPITLAAQAERIARAKLGLARLAQFDRSSAKGSRSKFSPAQRTSAAMIEWHLTELVQGESFRDHRFIFQQFGGVQVRLVNFLSQTHPIRNRRDIENYLARLDQVAAQMDEGIAQARERASRGFLPPKFILVSTLAQFDRFLSEPAAKNVLVASLEERAAKIKGLSAKARAGFVAAAEATTRETIIPAFRRARGLLESQLPQATEEAGLSRLPDGNQAYAHALREFTTTTLTASQIHDLGLREVARIGTEMDTLLRQLGYATGTIDGRMTQLNADSQPPANPDPRPTLIAEYTRLVRDAEKRAALIFDLRPKAPCDVRREPPFTEKSAAAHYTSPSKDGTRPGIFWAPLPGPIFRIINMRTLTYHEAVPGHHFQVALQSEMKSLPRFRRDRVFGGISAHSEGWALYAEQLAAENGWYEGDPKGRLGQLDAELFRAKRLVVDTGLHAKNWARQQAIDYGIPASEVERYVVFPGQACSYKIGMLKILELRSLAQRQLGPKFSLKEFHNVVLRTGSVPLPTLETVIADHIASNR